MAQVIEAGQVDGSIRPELPAATTASALVWMVERACQQNLPNKPPDYDTELVSALTEIAWGAMYLKSVLASDTGRSTCPSQFGDETPALVVGHLPGIGADQLGVAQHLHGGATVLLNADAVDTQAIGCRECPHDDSLFSLAVR